MDKSVRFSHLNICYVLYVLVAVTKNNDINREQDRQGQAFRHQ